MSTAPIETRIETNIDSSGDPSCERDDDLPIGEVRWRQRVQIAGRIRALRVQPWEGSLATLECTVVDDTGGLTLIFTGRRKLGGLKLGSRVRAEGMVLERRGQLAIMNPAYTLLPDESTAAQPVRRRGGALRALTGRQEVEPGR